MSVRKRGKNIVIDFRCYLPDGSRVRCVESEGPDTPENRKRVNLKNKGIEYAMKAGNFRYLDFFPHGSKQKYFDTKNAETFGAHFRQWMDERSLRSSTEKDYESLYSLHIAPVFGEVPISQITESRVLAFRKDLSGKMGRYGRPLATSSVNGIITVFCQILKKAHRKGQIPTYPCEGI